MERPARAAVRGLALLGALLALPAPARPTEPPPEVTVAEGRLDGIHDAAADAFLGIPYAAPPVGGRRWRAPAAPASWSGTRRAEHFGPSCIQRMGSDASGPWTHEYSVPPPVSEDCLYLNVWRPRAAGKHPVLLWIHGGAFQLGSASVPVYRGAALARDGLVVVTINYRVGVFGFLALPALAQEAHGTAPPANYGLQDMIAALRWVQRNIGAFGGDPEAVTIAGQSAGA